MTPGWVIQAEANVVTGIDEVIAKIRALPPDRQQSVAEFVASLEMGSRDQSDVPDIDPNRSIWQELSRLGREADAAPTDLPDDLVKNHDHYLHGMPKRQ